MLLGEQLSQEFEAIILAGGRGSRLGGLDKAALQLQGQTLAERAVEAVREAGARRITVVGPDSAQGSADRVLREEPPYAGPLAGIAAAIVHIEQPWVLVLACDLQSPGAVVRALVQSWPTAAQGDGVILVDQTDREQWLAGIYRTQALAESCRVLGENVLNAPVRRVLSQLNLSRTPISNDDSRDIDTPEALAQARKMLGNTNHESRN